MLYETPQDRLNEALVVGEFLCHLSGDRDFVYRAEKVDIQEGVNTPDFCILREADDQVIGYVEVKVRNYSWGYIKSMGGYKISAAKWDMLRGLVPHGYKAALVIKFTDCIGWYDVAKTKTKHVPAFGRQDRPDGVEEGYLLNPNQINIIEEHHGSESS